MTITPIVDLVAHIRNEAHQSNRATYIAMRRLYVKTKGRSRSVLIWLFRRIRPHSLTISAPAASVAQEVGREGVAQVPGFLSRDQIKPIRAYLDECKPYEVSSLKRQYPHSDLIAYPGFRDLMQNDFIHQIAADYLGAEPIFAGINAWWSLAGEPADGELSASAQMYHFDYDWPAFIKFFVYLTDVGKENGPFAFINGSHRQKPVWRDGRFSDEEIEAAYGKSDWGIVGSAGDLIVADTSGFHKGTPVEGDSRLILQLEFAVSRLGAGQQYALLPAKQRPDGPGHMFDMFAA